MMSPIAKVSLLLVMMAFQATSSPVADTKLELDLIEGSNLFAFQMYDQLSHENPESNVFFSPLSAHSALSMVLQGAQGSTASAVSKSLNVADASSAAKAYKNIMTSLNSVENVTLHIANKAYVMEGFTLLEPFRHSVTKNFHSEVDMVDFAKQKEAATKINDWVEHKTKDRIHDLISADDLSVDTRMVLVNAVYFKGLWDTKFPKEFTQKRPFYASETQHKDVDMMHLFKVPFMYKEDTKLNAQILELPYTNKDLKMVIILPKEKGGLATVQKKLLETSWPDVVRGLKKTEVNVVLPKFKIEQSYDLGKTLTKMGMGELFDESKANLRGIIDVGKDQNLYVSKVIQKAFIEVNEEGSEAAAATGVIMHTYSLVLDQKETDFVADQPFAFAITSSSNQQTGKSVVLFLGSITNVE